MASKNPYNHIYADWITFSRYINIKIAEDYLFQLERGNILLVHLSPTIIKKKGMKLLFLDFSSYGKMEPNMINIFKLSNDMRRRIIRNIKKRYFSNKDCYNDSDTDSQDTDSDTDSDTD
jgi:hypothetical protein